MFRLSPLGPFSLESSKRFLCGFAPGEGTCDVGDSLVLGFLSDDFSPVVCAVNRDLEVSAPSGAVAKQVARILSVDHDARGLERVLARDAVVRGLYRERPGFRPPLFASAYEAAVWAILVQRISMRAAAATKRNLSERTGSCVEGFGREFFPAPAPRRLLELKQFESVSAEKLARLHGVARAALDGKLDVDRLREMPEKQALQELESLRGIGAWSARHILYRGCGPTDALPISEPRLLRAISRAYGVRATPARAIEIAEQWRPFRMWISVLLVASFWSAHRKRKHRRNSIEHDRDHREQAQRS